MLFSIYIPLYNCEKYIGDAIESVLTQSSGDFELVIINDGSTDKSYEIACEYAKQDSRVRIFSQENIGLFHTRLVAFSLVEGDYVISLDADDLLLPGALSSLEVAIRAYPDSDMIYYSMVRFKDSKQRTLLECPEKQTFSLVKEYTRGENLEEYYRRLLLSDDLNSMCRKAIKKKLLLGAEGKLNQYPRITNGEDSIHTLAASANANKIILIDKVLYAYRYNTSSMTNRISERNFSSWKLLMNERRKYIDLYSMTDILPDFVLYQKKCLAKLIVYNPYSVRKTDKLIYFKMLEDIVSDEECVSIVSDISKLPLLYRLPLSLLKSHHYEILLCIKNLVAYARANAFILV